MLYNLLLTGYVFVCLLLVLLILIQKGKSSMGLGSLSGGTQMLFGGSGGQESFQKATWILGAIFLAGSLTLSIMRTTSFRNSGYMNATQQPVNNNK